MLVMRPLETDMKESEMRRDYFMERSLHNTTDCICIILLIKWVESTDGCRSMDALCCQ